ncbi:MAG: PAS domain S-box protein [Labilibaculum antarcticum]
MTIPNQKHTDLYRSLVLNSGDAMYLSNLDGKLIEVNKQACINLGYSREELLSLSLSDIDAEYKTEEQVSEFFTILEREKYCKLTTHHKRKDGSVIPVEVSISLLNENNSKLILGISRDISDHVEAKQNLFSYIDTLERIHPIIQNANDIEKIIWDVLNVVQEVFNTDRTFFLSSGSTKDSFQIPPFEIVKTGVSCISILDKSEIANNYQQEIFEKRKYHTDEVFTSNHSESEESKSYIKELHIKSEMIVAITNTNNTDYLLGVHECSKIREWTKLEKKLFIEISRRLGDAIKRLIYSHNLKQSEKKYKTLFDNAPLSYHSLNSDGDIMDVNNTWLKFLGYKKEDVLGKNYGDFLHPDWQHVFDTKFPKFKICGYVNDVHFKIRHQKGHYKYISLQGCTGCHPDGTFKQTYCVFQDITSRKKAEDKLKESEERYRLLMEQSPFTVEVYDLDGLQISVNKAYEELWQIPKELTLFKFNLLKSPQIHTSGFINYVNRAYAGETLDLPDHLFKSEIEADSNYEARSRWLRTRVYPIKDELDAVTHIVVVHTDITDQKEARKALIKSQDQFKIFIQQAPLPLSHVSNITGEVKYINKRFLDVFGYTHDDVSTMEKWWQLAYPDPEYRKFVIENWGKAVEVATKNKTDIIPEIYNISCKDGSVKQILVSGITLGDDFLSMLVDLTAQKKIEQELITAKEKAEENEKLKTAFLANMSHEIRTPMNGIMGFADLLQTPKLSPEKREKYIQIILQSGERMLTTINAIIEISKIETKQIVPFITEIDLTELIQNQCAFFTPEANKKNITLYCKPLTDKKSILSTDYILLNSIFTNLINNAIKYTNSGSIVFGCTKRNDLLEFFIKDTGIGIPKNVQHNIFDRFTRVDQENTKAIEGSGLGLSICKSYVELLGGEIWMESEEGIGSQFFFTLPIKN